MRTIFSVIVTVITSVIVGIVGGHLAGIYFAQEHPYSPEQEKAALAAKNHEADESQETATPTTVPDAETATPSGTRTSKPVPQAVLDEEEFNFGVFEKEQKGEHRFVVHNKGNANLTLTMLNKSCSCTNVDISQTSVAPGKDARITLSWKPNTTGGGSYTQGASIKTNDPNRPQFILRVYGVYSAPVLVSPNPLPLNAFASQEVSNQTRIYMLEPQPVNIRELLCEDAEHFAASFEKSSLTDEEKKNNMLDSAQSVYDLKVTLKPGLPFGPYQTQIRILSDSKLEPELTLTVKGQVFGSTSIISADYNPRTGVFYLGKTEHGTPLKKTLMIRFTQTEGETPEFKAEIQPEWLRAELGEVRGNIGDNRILPVTITIPEDAVLGSSTAADSENMAEIVITSSNKEMSTIRIPLEYSVAEKKN
ncbi:MAG: DUF1573 domain-containing protein [Planctomycetaceae bacterium]|jgi:hypothetical protein|nr:DUF1573 domain-containing protein [Planctomycetaceae bacterium]